MPSQPSRGGVTSPFGMRIHPITGTWRMHYGEDTIGTGNYAPVTGEVIFAAYDTSGMGFGNAVGIREDATGYVWWVAHHASISVPLHSRTSEGATYLGPKGMTGAATGPHAHTECRIGGTSRPGSGTAINPRTQYTGGGGGGGGVTPTPIIPTMEDDMPYLIYNPSSQHPDRRAWYVPGSKPKEITTDEATELAKVMKQLKRISSTTPDADVTTQWDDTMWATMFAVEPTIVSGGGGGSGGLTTEEHDKLMAVPAAEDNGAAARAAIVK